MSNQFRDIDPEALKLKAWEYINVCINSSKEVPTARGAVSIKERHLPTISYFLNIWLPLQDFEMYGRTNWYTAKNDTNHPLSNTIKLIDENFTALATDIVANEGKGIFYAKNKLGMTDKMQEDGKKEININVTRGNRNKAE